MLSRMLSGHFQQPPSRLSVWVRLSECTSHLEDLSFWEKKIRLSNLIVGLNAEYMNRFFTSESITELSTSKKTNIYVLWKDYVLCIIHVDNIIKRPNWSCVWLSIIRFHQDLCLPILNTTTSCKRKEFLLWDTFRVGKFYQEEEKGESLISNHRV